MPPHRDSMDGSVVAATRLALPTDDVDSTLGSVRRPGTQEFRDAFAAGRGRAVTRVVLGGAFGMAFSHVLGSLLGAAVV